ncbi:hypothetical protein ACFLY8_03450 [Halobacteriota archaeon]
MESRILADYCYSFDDTSNISSFYDWKIFVWLEYMQTASQFRQNFFRNLRTYRPIFPFNQDKLLRRYRKLGGVDVHTDILYQKPEIEIEKRNNNRKQIKVDYEIMKRIIEFKMPRYREG